METHYYRVDGTSARESVLNGVEGDACPLATLSDAPSAVKAARRPVKTLTYLVLIVFWVLCLVVGSVDAAVIVSKERVQEAVQAYVLETFGDFDGRMEVTVRRQRDLRVEGTGSVDLVVRTTGRQTHSRSIPLKLELYRGPAKIGDHLLAADIRYFDHVAVAAHPLQRWELVRSEDLRFENREVTNLLGGYVRDAEALRGLRTKTRIGVGRVLQMRLLEKIPVVERRDRVRIDVRIGSIRVSATGVATESGAIGDQIVVQNTESREKLLVEVVGPGTVRIVLPE